MFIHAIKLKKVYQHESNRIYNSTKSYLTYIIYISNILFSGLKCLKIILNDGNRKLEAECQKALTNRLEMYKHVAAVSYVMILKNVNLPIK